MSATTPDSHGADTQAASGRGWAVILAAGKGTRMRSKLAKVLHPVLGRPMVAWPAEAAQAAGLSVVLVVNHQEDAVRRAMTGRGVGFARQEVPRGTGDAVAAGVELLPESGTVVVLNGDGPLIRSRTITRLLDVHAASGDRVTVVSMKVDDPGSYGRIVRDEQDRPLRIVEASDASAQELAIDEVNTGLYAMDIAWLRSVLPNLVPHPPKGEIYLTDCLELAARGDGAGALVLGDPSEALGVNSQVERSVAQRILQARIVDGHMRRGVAFEDPLNVTVEPGVTLEADCVIERGVVLRGASVVGEDAIIGAHSVLESARVASGAVVLPHSILEQAVVGEGAKIGPFARLRLGTVIGRGCKVGNFVETKKAILDDGAKVSHLSYIGDARVGAGANVGAGTITCNYDGFSKQRTDIGAGSFVGSNTALVAPVKIGEGAIVGAGSVIVRDVPADAIAVARGEQRVKEGAAGRFRSRRKTKKAGK